MSPHWSKKKSSGKRSFIDWLREQFTLGEHSQQGVRRLQFEHLEPRTMLSNTQASPVFQVNFTTAGGGASESAVACDAAGDFVVAWLQYLPGTLEVFAQRYSSAGAPEGSAFRVDSTADAAGGGAVAAAMDAAGDFVVVWEGNFNQANDALYAQRYTSSGAASGNAITVATTGASPTAGTTAMAMDSAGDFVVAWLSESGDILAERYSSAGAAQGSEFQVAGTAGPLDKGDRSPAVAMDSEGDFVVAWVGYVSYHTYYAYAQRYNAAGAAQGGIFPANSPATEDIQSVGVAMDAGGDFILTYAGSEGVIAGGKPVDYGVYAERFTPAGVGGEEFDVSVSTSPVPQAVVPTVAMDSGGDFVVTWQAESGYGQPQLLDAQRYSSSDAPQGSAFQVATYGARAQEDPLNSFIANVEVHAVMDSEGDFVLAWNSYTNSDFAADNIFAQQYQLGPSGSTVTINGDSSSNVVNITFTDATDFNITLNGGAPTDYSTATDGTVMYNAPTSGFSELIFSDPSHTYKATQSFNGTSLASSKFDFTANGVTNLYVYGAAGSTATVNVPTGADSDFFVDDTAAATPYSYIGNPATGDYSELSGFSSETVAGSAATTYAYIYSTSNATTTASPTQTTFTVGSATMTLSNFPQVYVVGAADGTDSVTLDSSGSEFVGTPGFSYVAGTSGGASFLLGALYAAHVTGQAAGSSDTAVFYSYAGNTFSGAPGTSSLTGSTVNVASSSVNFAAQASGYSAASVFESGAGTDVADLTSPGNGSFLGTSTASTLTVGTSTITVNTYFVSSGQTLPVAGTLVVTGNHDGTDSASIEDAAGSNALTASGSTAVLTTALGSVTINKFGSVTAAKGNGSSDTVHQGTIDFTLTASGWTSV